MTDSNDREKELIRGMACGDRVAAREFYDSYSGYLTAVCCRYISASDDVKDVMQESFVKIFGSIGRFEYRGDGSLRGWAVRIVVNESLKWLEERKRLRVITDADDIAEKTESDMPDPENIPTSAILDMIRSLPDGYRTVFNLYVFEQKSHREIAAMLNIAESSSASQLHRAKGLLAKQIKKYSYG